MEILIILGAVAFVAFGWAHSQKQLSDRHSRARVIAERFGLQVRGNDELVGRHRGVPLRMYSKDHGSSSNTQWWTHTRCTLSEPLASGLRVTNQGVMGALADLIGFSDVQLGTPLDPKLRIVAQQAEEARELLTDEDVEVAIWEILGVDGRIDLGSAELEVRVRGRHLEAVGVRLKEAVDLVHALAGAGQGAWRAVAELHGLAINPAATLISGDVDGIGLRIELDSDRRTWVRASLPQPLPAGTRIVHKDRGSGDVRLGDPILDTLVSVRTGAPEVLAARISRDEVRGPLLELVHGMPGAEVRSNELVFVASGRLGKRLLAVTDTVLAAARALSTGG